MDQVLIPLPIVVASAFGRDVTHASIEVEPATTITATAQVAPLNVRKGPSITADRITLLPFGISVPVLGRDKSGKWLKISTCQGSTGWVAALCVSLSSGQVNSLPIVLPVLDTSLVGEPATDILATAQVAQLNVRSGPRITASRVTVLNTGMFVPVLGRDRDGKWLKIRTCQGRTGWVAALCVSLSSGQVNSLPITS